MKAGTLTVATEGTYRPFSYHDDGSGDLVGYDVEVAEAVADKLGLEIEFQETQWDAIFAGLDAGRFDVIANQVSINPEREEQYLFSAPYTVSPGVVVVNEGDDSISSFDDLAGKTTAQSLTSNWYELAADVGRERRGRRGLGAGRRAPRAGPRRRDHQRQAHLPRLREARTARRELEVAAETDDPSLSALAFTKDKADLVDGRRRGARGAPRRRRARRARREVLRRRRLRVASAFRDRRPRARAGPTASR